MIFLGLDPASLHRARQVCKEWNEFLLARVWGAARDRLTARLTRSWLGGQPSLSRDDYWDHMVIQPGVLAMDPELLVIGLAAVGEKGAKVVERRTGRIVASVPFDFYKKAGKVKLDHPWWTTEKNKHIASVALSDKFIILKSGWTVGVFSRPNLEDSAELTLLGCIDLGQDNEGMNQAMAGLGDLVIIGPSFVNEGLTTAFKLKRRGFSIVKTFVQRRFLVDENFLLLVGNLVGNWFEPNQVPDDTPVLHVYKANNLDEEVFAVKADVNDINRGTIAFKFPYVASLSFIPHSVHVWNVTNGQKQLKLNLEDHGHVMKLHFVYNLLVLTLDDQKLNLGLVDLNEKDPILQRRVFSEIKLSSVFDRPLVYFDNTSVLAMADNDDVISTLNFWC